MQVKLIILLSLLITGCDIPGIIIIKNNSGYEASYHTDFREGGQQYDDIHFRISADKKRNEAGIMMGLGFFWTNERIDWYADEINKIEIRSYRDTIVLTEKEHIVSHFRKNRHGLFKNVIKIKIE